jgi:hypothetical protein
LPEAAAASSASRVGEQHQRQQPGDLWFVGHQRVQHPGQADRLVAQLVPDQLRTGGSDVALGEEQREDREHGRQPVRQLVTVGYPVRDPRVADLGLGSCDALGDGGLAGQEQPRDFGG